MSSNAATGDSVEDGERGGARAAPRRPCRGGDIQQACSAGRPAEQPARLVDASAASGRTRRLGAPRRGRRARAPSPACRSRCPAPGSPSSSSSGRSSRRAVGVHGRGPAGQDQAARLRALDLLERRRCAAAAPRRRRTRARGGRSAASTGRRSRGPGPLGRACRGVDPRSAAGSASVLAASRAASAALSLAAAVVRPRVGVPAVGVRRRGGRRGGAHADRLVALQLLALALERRRDHHLRAVEGGDVLVAAGGHRGAQAAHQVERAVVLVGGAEQDLLERAVLGGLDARAARERRVEGGHAPVEAAARRLVGARERRADHHRVGAAGERLRDVAAVAHAAVGDHLHVLARLEHVLRAGRLHVGDRGGLRDADPEHAARGAGGARADADEHADRAGAHEVEAGRVGGAAADHDGDRDLADELLEVERLGSRRSRRARPRRRCPG